MTPVFRPENALEEAMLHAYERDDVDALLRALSLADVYLPSDEAPGSDAEEERTLGEGDELALPTIEGPDGLTYVPVFSSLAQLERVDAPGYGRLRGRALACVLPPDLGLALNPGGELGLPLPPEQVARLAHEPAAESGEAGYLIGEPKEEPTELLDAVRRFAESRTDIRALYRALIVRAPGASGENVVGLELDAGADPDAVVDAAADAVRGSGVERAGFLPLAVGLEAGAVGRFMLERTEPFWTRR